jgi:tellurite resistance protein
VDPETRAYLDDFRRELSSELGRRLDSVEQRVEATRRELGVLIEDVRHDVRAVAQIVVAKTEAIGQLRSRLDAR